MVVYKLLKTVNSLVDVVTWAAMKWKLGAIVEFIFSPITP